MQTTWPVVWVSNQGEDGQVALVPAIHTCMKQMHGMNAFQTNYIYIYLIRRPCFSVLAVWAGLSEQEEVPVATMVLVLAVALGAAVVVQQVLAADLQQVLLGWSWRRSRKHDRWLGRHRRPCRHGRLPFGS